MSVDTEKSDATDSNKTTKEVDTSTEDESLDELGIAKRDLEKAREGESYERAQRKKYVAKLAEATKALKGYELTMPEYQKTLEAAKQSEIWKTKLDETEKAFKELNGKVTNGLMDTAIDAVFKEVKAIAPNSTKKLVDRSKIVIKDGIVDTESVKSAVQELMKSDPTLFGKPEVERKPAGEQPTLAGYSEEVAAVLASNLLGSAKQQQFDAIRKKYGRA